MKRVTTSLRIPASVHAKIKEAAYNEELSINKKIVQLLTGSCKMCRIKPAEYCEACLKAAYDEGKEAV